jgi:hypothetical protein
MMANPTFSEAIGVIARALRQGVPSHAHLNGAAARIDHLGRRLHGLGCVRDREIAACFTAAIAELDASHGFAEGARGEAVARAAGQMEAALAFADEWGGGGMNG